MVLSPHLRQSRILSLRPLRPPAYSGAKAQVQPFSRHAQLLLLTRYTPRPQVPYLAQPLSRRLSPLDQHVLRLLSTDTKRKVRDFTWLTIKWTAITWTILSLVNLTLWGILMETEERNSPTPVDWNFWTRMKMRSARMHVEAWRTHGFINWAAAGHFFGQVLERLEDENSDGKGTTAQEDDAGETIMIAGAGTVGRDVSSKSWTWIQGYFEALMGMAHVSESTDNMVRDVTRNLVFPQSTVIGPSNPDPRPVTKHMEAAPLEENCQKAFDPPENYYLKILTGNGFTTRQKIAATSGYANWLEFNGLNDAAEEMLKWGIDVANAASTGDASTVSKDSYVLKQTSNGSGPSENLLRALTAYAVHQARTEHAGSALPILLSVLRARREAPVSPLASAPPQPAKQPTTDIGVFLHRARSFLDPRPTLEQPLSGNTPYMQPLQPTCEDSELMLYIGEIMYATTAQKGEALAWTKQAANIAETGMLQPTLNAERDVRREQTEARKCRQCLTSGVENWEFMLNEMSAQLHNAPRSSSWLGGTIARPDRTEAEISTDRERIAELKDTIAHNKTDMILRAIRESGDFRMF